MQHKSVVLALFSLILLTLGGCSSHTMAMKYQPTSSTGNSILESQVSVGQVIDNRNTPPNWLGAIRGGYGNPLKKIYTDKNTADAVAEVFKDGLMNRGLYAEAEKSTYKIDVELTKFDASQMIRKEAHAHFRVTLTGQQSGQSVFDKHYQTDKRAGGSGPGLFGSTTALGKFANQALNESIDKVLNDPEFIAALRQQKVVTRTKGSTLDRLKELESLKTAGLISAIEYRGKRQKLLNDL